MSSNIRRSRRYNERYPQSSPRLFFSVRASRLIALFVATLLVAGCGIFGPDPAEEAEGVVLRTPHATFTPTPRLDESAAQAATTPLPPAQPAIGGAIDTPAGETVPVADTATAQAVVNTALVNTREGPGTEFPVVAMVERGSTYDIIGRNAEGTWWHVCCVNGVSAWIIGEYVDTLGASDSAPVTGGVGQARQQPPAVAPTPAPGGDEPAAAPVQFTLRKQEQFPESTVVRLYAFIYTGTSALAGYSVRVVKDGTELPVDTTSFGGQPAFTWPFQDARQRHQNLKLEFPGVTPAGEWKITLIDSSGAVVGPEATFTLAENDTQMELYVRYERQ